MSGRTAGFGLYFVSFVLLMAAGALVVAAGVTFLASLTPLYLSIGLSVAAIARKTERGERPHPMSRNNSNSDRDLRGARPFSGAGHPLVPFDTETLS